MKCGEQTRVKLETSLPKKKILKIWRKVQVSQVLNYVAYPLVFHTKKVACASCLERQTNKGEKNNVQGPSMRCAAQMRRGLYSLWAMRSHGKFCAQR